MNGQRHRVNRPHVICETFDDEVVAVNFDTGSYYGMMRAALEVWNALDAGQSEEDIAVALAVRYEQDVEKVRADLRQFVSQLEEEHLIVSAEGPGEDPGTLAAKDAGGSDYEPPRLSVYHDMQDLLLLDPVHEVDESGWPARKPAN